MRDCLSLLSRIKKEFIILQKENFEVAPHGTHHKVFLSKEYVVRLRDDNPELLLREVNFLKQLDHPLIPRVLWVEKVDTSIVMVENRLSGKTVSTVWKSLVKGDQINIVRQLVEFIRYLKMQTRDYVYSVNTGKIYNDFQDHLADTVIQKIAGIKKIKQAAEILKELLLVIEKPEIKNLFSGAKNVSLVHGDLIIHNLLTDGRNLTGVLDWELALFGDPDYDLFRLFYYKECARAYQEQGIDEAYESDYMDKLSTAILKSDLIEDEKLFQRKYKFVRAIFFLNALHWAVNSDEQEKNINELIIQWNKNGVKH